jgi:hypothetical protein
MLHLANQGDVYYHGGFSGTRGQSRACEGFAVTSVPVPNVTIKYKVHMANIGDGLWTQQPAYAGTTKQSRQIEGFYAELEGSDAGLYDLKYTAHLACIQDDVAVCQNGDYCGTVNQGRRLEGITMWLESRLESEEVQELTLRLTFPTMEPLAVHTETLKNGAPTSVKTVFQAEKSIRTEKTIQWSNSKVVSNTQYTTLTFSLRCDCCRSFIPVNDTRFQIGHCRRARKPLSDIIHCHAARLPAASLYNDRRL